MLHTEFKVETWSNIAQGSNEAWMLRSSIGGPLSACRVHAARKEFSQEIAQIPDAKWVSADVFVWGIGEPLQPELTKVGGLPLWNAHEPWPSDETGPIPFVMQLSFVDSKNTIDVDLPGDVLAIFGRELQRPQNWRGIWVKILEAKENLVRWADVPVAREQVPLFAHLWRTQAVTVELFDWSRDFRSDGKYENLRTSPDFSKVARYWATQVCSSPFQVWKILELKETERVIGAISPVWAHRGMPWQVLNCEGPLDSANYGLSKMARLFKVAEECTLVVVLDPHTQNTRFCRCC